MGRLRAFLLGLLALVGLVLISGGARATSFNPASSLCVLDSGGDSDCNGIAGANADLKSTLCIGLGADCQPGTGDESADPNFDLLIDFLPLEWGFGSDGTTMDGALAAKLSSTATLGLINGACATSLSVNFDMLDATTNTSGTVPFHDPEPLDYNDSQGSEPDDQFDIGADGLPLGVTRYPDYLTRIFEGLTPRSRLYGQIEVAGIEDSVNFVLFEPGTRFQTPVGEVKTDARLGYPTVTVFQTAGDPATEAKTGDNNAVSDFCSPLLSTTTIFGNSKDNPDTAADESGATVRTNPGGGTYDFLTFIVSQRDADGDGIENRLDPCPTVPNLNWTPRINPGQAGYTGDEDQDSLPDDIGCDPNPSDPGPISGGNRDQDQDQYGNRADNCPLVANSAGQPGGTGPDNQADGDGDGIGDQCDPNPLGVDGHNHAVCLVSTIDVSGGGAQPVPDPQDVQPCDPGAPNDGDGDGYEDGDEVLIGTDALNGCPASPEPGDEDPDPWPADFDDNQVVNILDVIPVLPPYFGSSTGEPNYSPRRDLVPDGVINILDVTKVLPPAFGSSCVP